ncbi:MAG TPA: hypothetical protein VGV89_05835 [Thermoplasmata archaeon]|nr:hypothetical protein [Thermoplasmata archaeon]
MPASSQRVYATQKVRVVKTIDVPAKYAYTWLTDFRESDGFLSSRKPEYSVQRIGNDQVVRVRKLSLEKGQVAVAVELVRLMPPNRWHVDQIDVEDLETVDYTVRGAGPRRCRVELRMVERWMVPKHPSAAQVRDGTAKFWDKIALAIEEDYRKGRAPDA